MTSSYALGDLETRIVNRIKRQQAQWPYVRWVWLVLSLGAVAVGIYVELEAVRSLHDTSLAFSQSSAAVERSFNGSLVFLSCLATKNATLGELLRWAGIFLLIVVIGRWRGHPVQILLLRLIAQRNEAPSGIPGPL